MYNTIVCMYKSKKKNGWHFELFNEETSFHFRFFGFDGKYG